MPTPRLDPVLELPVLGPIYHDHVFATIVAVGLGYYGHRVAAEYADRGGIAPFLAVALPSWIAIYWLLFA